MKMAKASEADLNMAMDLSNALDLLGQRFCPCMPEAIELLGPEDESERFDRDNDKQCGRALRHLLEIADRASLSRVIFGMVVLLDPRNEVVDPGADTLDLHPKHAEAAAMLKVLALPEASTMSVHDWSRLTRADADRSAPQYAIEHAEYLAQRAERLLEALKSEDEAHMRLNDLDFDDPEFEAADQAHTEAIATRGEVLDSVRRRIHEFRKRTDRPVIDPAKARHIGTEQTFTTQRA